MTRSPYIDLALPYLAPGAKPWESPTPCREIVAGLRADGDEYDLADQLERAIPRPHHWFGMTVSG